MKLAEIRSSHQKGHEDAIFILKTDAERSYRMSNFYQNYTTPPSQKTLLFTKLAAGKQT
jgi:hypothetical protein